MSEWAQYGAMFVAVTAASAWLTSRWLLRRRAGACASCEHPCERPKSAFASAGSSCHGGDVCDGRGLRSPALRVMQNGPQNS